MNSLRWYEVNGRWSTRCGRFSIVPGFRFKLFDYHKPGGPYATDSVKEAKQLAKRISRKS